MVGNMCLMLQSTVRCVQYMCINTFEPCHVWLRHVLICLPNKHLQSMKWRGTLVSCLVYCEGFLLLPSQYLYIDCVMLFGCLCLTFLFWPAIILNSACLAGSKNVKFKTWEDCFSLVCILGSVMWYSGDDRWQRDLWHYVVSDPVWEAWYSICICFHCWR